LYGYEDDQLSFSAHFKTILDPINLLSCAVHHSLGEVISMYCAGL
jgi:hypothetical protein